jgi:thioredoxin-related protein
MKKIKLWLAMLPMLVATTAIAQVNFNQSQDFAAMQASAQQQGKFIFIDAYTDWCGWCKVMDKNTFSNEKVASFMKNAFVSYKLEMEKDSLGKLLSMKYAITGFPSYLIFNQEGQLHTVLVGYMEVEAWLATLEETLSKPTPERPAITSEIGLDWPEFYQNAFGVSGKRKAATTDEVLDYLGQNELNTEMPFTIAKRYSAWLTPEFANDVLARRAELSELFGADLVDDFINNILQSRIRKQIGEDDEAALEKSLEEYMIYFPEAENIRPQVYQSFYLKHKKYSELVELVEANFDSYNAAGMNSLCWDLYSGCDDPSVLKKASLWMEDVVNREPTYAYLDTYAALLYKTGAYKDAEIWAGKAIKAGKADNEEVEETEKLLEKIKEARKK